MTFLDLLRELLSEVGVGDVSSFLEDGAFRGPALQEVGGWFGLPDPVPDDPVPCEPDLDAGELDTRFAEWFHRRTTLFISTAELARAWDLSPQRIRAVAARVPGAQKVGRSYVFPEAAKRQKEQILNSKFRKKS